MAGIINKDQGAAGISEQRQARAAVLGEVAADVYNQKHSDEEQRTMRAYGRKKALQAKNSATTRRWTVTDEARAKAKKARGY